MQVKIGTELGFCAVKLGLTDNGGPDKLGRAFFTRTHKPDALANKRA